MNVSCDVGGVAVVFFVWFHVIKISVESQRLSCVHFFSPRSLCAVCLFVILASVTDKVRTARHCTGCPWLRMHARGSRDAEKSTNSMASVR